MQASLICAMLLFAALAHGQQENIAVSTNEGRAMKTLRSLLSVETEFLLNGGTGEYADLNELHKRKLIDETVASGVKDGYRFTVVLKKSTLTSAPSIDLIARPLEYSKTGKRSFYLNESGVLLTSDARNADPKDMRPFVGESARTSASSTSTLDPVRTTETESAAKVTLRTIYTAQISFRDRIGKGQYGTLRQLETEKLLDKTSAAASHNGYVFAVELRTSTDESPAAFSITATPEKYGTTGKTSFFLDDSGVLRAADKDGAAADLSDPPADGLPAPQDTPVDFQPTPPVEPAADPQPAPPETPAEGQPGTAEPATIAQLNMAL